MAGYADLNSFSATDAQHFFDEYYIPSNMVVAVVGDVKASETLPIIEKYFGRIPSRERPDERTTTEPPQNSERRVVLYDRSQPLYLEGYHRPDYRSPDDAVYDAIADLMSNGRTSRLYRALVRDKKIAAYSAGFTGLPGNKYPHLFAFYAFPLPGHKNEEVAEAIHAEIDRLKKEDISDEELKMIGRGPRPTCCADWMTTKAWPPRSPCIKPSMATGANFSTRWRTSTR